MTSLTCMQKSVSLVAIYRPPRNSVVDFLNDFEEMLERIICTPTDLLIVGDFNINMLSLTDPAANRLRNMLEVSGLSQHVQNSTHQNGHLLDLVISRPSNMTLSMNPSDVSVSSDHACVCFTLQFPKPLKVTKCMTVRKFRAISTQALCQDLLSSDLNNLPLSDCAAACSLYDQTLKDLMNKHAPAKNVTITVRPDAPWYNYDIRCAKREYRRLERQWKESRLSVHLQMLHTQRNRLTQIRRQAKVNFYSTKVSMASSPKELFSITNTLLQKKKDSKLPSSQSDVHLADNFAKFFEDKISSIRNCIPSSAPTPNPPLPDFSLLLNFRPVTEEEITKLIKKSPCKSSALDPIPTWLMRDCLTSMVPIISSIVNLSISTGCVPCSLKQAIITPLLKKPSLDPEALRNYRPVSNLSYLSKLMERVIVRRIQQHCVDNNIVNNFQSAYKQQHSTETALIRVQNDILEAVDKEGGAILVLLDLSAAFDTIDHNLLLQHLQYQVGITDRALKWCTSYLDERTQQVKVRDSLSSPCKLKYGVPQGSVLGPLLFSLYTQSLSSIISLHHLQYHLYADDTQLYIACAPESSSVSSAVITIESAVCDIKSWMDSHFLKLNEDKTEVLVIRRPSPHSAHPVLSSVNICGCHVSISPSVKDLGVVFDCTFGLENHVNSVCKIAFFHLHSIWKVRRYLTTSSTRDLVQAYVTSRLDYCNGLYYGLPATIRSKLQRVQNAAARVITKAKKSDHITPILQDLHWLPIQHRVDYKIQLLTFIILQGLVPPYLQDIVQIYTPNRTLRSSQDCLLVRPTFNLQTVGGRAFKVSAPHLWNKLPKSIRMCQSMETFKTQLKTFHFKNAFNISRAAACHVL